MDPTASSSESAPAPTPRRPFRRDRLLGLLAPLLALLLYAPTLWFQFVWDDTYFVEKNEAIRTLANIPRFFADPTLNSSFSGTQGIYRPLRNVTYALDYSLWTLRPGGYHFTNILLHAFNTGLVYFLILAMLRGIAKAGSGGENDDGVIASAHPPATPVSTPPAWASIGAFLGAFLWAVHPLATEAVCWVKSRDDLLVALFCLAGALLVARWDWQRRPRIRDIVFFLLLQVGAVFSKETGVMFPAFALLVAWAVHFSRRPLRETLRSPWARRLVAILVLSGILDLAYLALRYRVMGEFGQLTHPPATGTALFWTQLRVTAHGLLLFVWPVHLLADYQAFRISTGAGAAEWIALFVVAGLLIAALALLRRAPVFSLAVLWWFAAILPVSNLIPTMQLLAERFLYLALAGPAIGFGILTAALLRRGRRQATRITLAASAVLLLLLVARTVNRIPVWGDRLSLYETTFREAPSNTRVRANYAKELFRLGRYADSLAALEGLPPGHPTRIDFEEDARYLAAHGAEIDPALQAVDSNPAAIGPRLRVGELAIRAHLPETATKQFETVLRRDPGNWRALAGLAVVQMRLGRREEALKTFQSARRAAAPVSRRDPATSSTLRRYERSLQRGPWSTSETE